MRLWPLLVVVFVLLPILQSGQEDVYRYHPSRLGRAVFGVAQTVFAKPLAALANWMGAEDQNSGLFAVLALLFLVGAVAGVTALLIGLTASNGRLMRRLAAGLKKRARPALNLAVSSAKGRYMTRLRQQSAALSARHKRYAQLLSYDLNDLTPQLPRAHITLYDQGYRREAWRRRRVYHMQAEVPLPISLPTMIVMPKRLDSERSSINDLLGNTQNFVRLEGNFSDVFDLYVARGYELYALQILNPSVMLKLMQKAPDAWIELDGQTLGVLQMGLPISQAELEKFELLTSKVAAILQPYITQQVKRGKKAALSYEKFPATITLRPLVSDWLLYSAAGTLFLTGVIAFVSSLFTPLTTTSRSWITGSTIQSPTVWGDTLEAISLLVAVLVFVAMLAGEVEAHWRHLRWQHHRRRALRLKV